MAQIRLRDAGMDDQHFLRELYCLTRAAEVAAWGWPPEQQRAFLEAQHQMRQQQYDALGGRASTRVVLDGERPVGVLVLIAEPDARVLADIALLPAYQGAGIGGALIQAELDAAARAGQRVTLHVLATNPAARLYARLGFRVTDDDGLYLTMCADPNALP
jgi:ribosomal protein S18 acetylase RimI-like enzyme